MTDKQQVDIGLFTVDEIATAAAPIPIRSRCDARPGAVDDHSAW